MLPSTNKGVGMNFGMPDICITPVGPVPTPVPYPNMAMHATAMPFSETVFLSMVPALNEISEIPMTLGDQAGTLSPNSGPGRFTMGNPMVLIEELPGINLLCPTSGNNFIDALGSVLIPSITTVFFTDATRVAGIDANDHAKWGFTLAGEVVTHVARGSAAAAAGLAIGDRVSEVREASGTLRLHLAESGRELCLSEQRPREAVTWYRAGAIGVVEMTAIPHDAAPRVRAAVAAMLEDGAQAVMLDLRGNGGGVLEAAIEVAGLFLPRGTTICRLRHDDGDESPVLSRTRHPFSIPLGVIVDGGSASSAEVVAAALQANARAVISGQTTYGKATAAGRGVGRGGDPRQITVLEVLRPDGAAIHTCGVTPDNPVSTAVLDFDCVDLYGKALEDLA
jgi:carboxyl-terminal processing protease